MFHDINEIVDIANQQKMDHQYSNVIQLKKMLSCYRAIDEWLFNNRCFDVTEIGCGIGFGTIISGCKLIDLDLEKYGHNAKNLKGFAEYHRINGISVGRMNSIFDKQIKFTHDYGSMTYFAHRFHPIHNGYITGREVRQKICDAIGRDITFVNVVKDGENFIDEDANRVQLFKKLYFHVYY